MTKPELPACMRSHRLAVVCSLADDGAPQAALVGIAMTDAFEIIFDTTSVTRKHANLMRDARASMTFSGPDEQSGGSSDEA